MPGRISRLVRDKISQKLNTFRALVLNFNDKRNQLPIPPLLNVYEFDVEEYRRSIERQARSGPFDANLNARNVIRGEETHKESTTRAQNGMREAVRTLLTYLGLHSAARTRVVDALIEIGRVPTSTEQVRFFCGRTAKKSQKGLVVAMRELKSLSLLRCNTTP